MDSGIVVVTGAAGSLGRAVVARLAEDGIPVAAVYRADTRPLPPGEHFAVDGVDLTSAQSTRRAFDSIAARGGGIGGLVNAAGGFAWAEIEGGGIAIWDHLCEINLKTAVNACAAALPHLTAGGSIVNVGAAAAGRAEIGNAAYAASKAGVVRLTESLAAELKPKGIRANAVLPTIIDTAPNRAAMPDADFDAWVTPAELANVIAFLLSPRASAINGAAIPVAGRL